ncbi:MAG: penicillin acylase family protein [Flammeovirgaceae bacterium]|nr:MAG: penicillin acylase family protein [Flammeovirgaceae bacterium]
MKIWFAALLFVFACQTEKQKATELVVPGLLKPVELFRDSAGINHIFAQNEHDLFFAQGYCAAKDRLFQFEVWRRQASGTLSEILGEDEAQRDIGARLFKYRGDLEKEFNHYHPRGKEIITAFTNGINAFIAETEKNPELLPTEFGLLGIKPGYWTPELVVSRHQGLLGNLTDELNIARAVALLGVEKVKDLKAFEPGTPRLTLDPSIDASGLFEPVIGLYEAFRKPVLFTPNHLAEGASSHNKQFQQVAGTDRPTFTELFTDPDRTIGSNNWIVSGSKTTTGLPMLANDPHRAVTVPSLRYIVHLNAPGWNVVGGGEPTIPGVSIGHNAYGAWGLTVFNIDVEDLMVYELNPKNELQYRYKGNWENMKVVHDTIRVKNASDVYVAHKYTRHGPVTFIDKKRNKAYAVRCAWLEPGGAPYLASLRMNTAQTWEEFREACSYSHVPGENMIWADKAGNIGWQVVGIAPVRKNWDGLVPVPGDGRYEWEGFLPIRELPHLYNPEKGYWATANENLVPADYPHRHAVGWEWADSSRAKRIEAVLSENKKFSQADLAQLQFDYYSLPASRLTPYLKDISFSGAKTDSLKNLLLRWNYMLDKNSVEAAVYMAWEKRLIEKAYPLFVPEKARPVIRGVSLRKVIHWIAVNRPELGTRSTFLKTCFEDAVQQLTVKLGSNTKNWQYGQPAYHHIHIKHPLSNALSDSLQKIFNCGPLPRGGSASTPNVTSNNDNQSHGATFRMVADVSDWDNTTFTNSPGQSGDVRSVFYRNLFEGWAKDTHFKVYFSRAKIESNAHEKNLLTPHAR